MINSVCKSNVSHTLQYSLCVFVWALIHVWRASLHRRARCDISTFICAQATMQTCPVSSSPSAVMWQFYSCSWWHRKLVWALNDHTALLPGVSVSTFSWDVYIECSLASVRQPSDVCLLCRAKRKVSALLVLRGLMFRAAASNLWLKINHALQVCQRSPLCSYDSHL